MNRKIQQVKDTEKKSANIQRTASYRLALRRSAPPETEDLLTKANENSPESDQTVVTSQPTNETKVNINESIDVQTIEPFISEQKTNGDNSLKNNEEKSGEEVNGCTKFCCRRLCCDYCKCCPNCCSLKMKRLETFLIHITDCGLNCLRVFT